MQNISLFNRLIRGDLAIIFYMSLLRLLLHLVINAFGGYGIFRDELYYLACADHLAAGYVDQPPLSVYILKAATLLFGDSLFAIRLVPAFAAATTVFLTGLMTMRMGGNTFAQFLACLCSFSLITLAMNSFYSMNSIDILIWTATAYLTLLILQRGNKKYWVLLGVVLGLGLLNKISVLFLGAGLFTGLLFTKERKWFATPWPYIAGGIAFVLFVPYIVWNFQNDLAHLEFIHNASSSKYSSLSALGFIRDQFLINNPSAAIIWLPGTFALLFNASLSRYRLLAFLFLVPFFIFIINGTSKPEYLSPAFSILWAAGSVWFVELFKGKAFAPAINIAVTVLILIPMLILLPMVLPVLPVEKYISYADKLGFTPDSAEAKEVAELPQFYADMFGWEEKARVVGLVYNSLAEDDKGKCAIFASNYGRCGAIDYYGKRYGLPKAIGNHNNYLDMGSPEL